jgi:uncharacterized protein (TIGR02594 family)
MKNLILSIFEALKAIFGPKPDPQFNPPAKLFRNFRLMKMAEKELGVKEWKNGSNPRVEDYHRFAERDNKKGMSDDIAWCSSFACAICEWAGLGSTNSRLARSWTRWGVSTKKDPWPFDIVVFWRGSKSGWQGHVGFLVKEETHYVYVLGGNQNDEVNITRYSKQKLLDIRRSSLHRKISEQELLNLRTYANNLLSRYKVSHGGSQS